MAKNQKQFEGWSYNLAVDGSDSKIDTTPRTRRSRKSEDVKLILKRDDDGLQLEVGDCVLVDSKHGSPEVGIIREVQFGTDDFIEIKVMWFIRIENVDVTSLPKDESETVTGELFPKQFSENDIFITAMQDKIYVQNIIDRAKVLSIEEFNSIVIDETNKDTTFVCQRGCNSSADEVTEQINWKDLTKLLLEDSNQFLQRVKSLTVAPTVKAAKDYTPKKLVKHSTKVTPGKRKVISYREPDSDSDDFESAAEMTSDSDVQSLNSSESEILEDSDVEFQSSGKRSRRSTKSTPRKKNRKLTKSSFKREGSLPSLPSRSRLNFGDTSDHEEEMKTPIFKQARKRLHANAKLKGLPCREEEFGQIYLSIEDAVESQIGTCIYVSGTPGTGKTATIREVIKQLAENYLGKNDTSDELFDYVEINGLKLITPQASYEVLWEKITGEKIAGSNAVVLLDSYFQTLDKNRKPLIVLMDELDQIVTKTQTVMYNFFNWPTYAESKLIVIAVANTMDLPERMLTNKISSRLGLKRLQFPGYDFKQLAEIIKHRLEDLERLNSGKLIIKKDAIEFAARKVASVSGDARRALIICRRAIEIAEWEYFKAHQDEEQDDLVYTVQISHIMKAVNETTNSPVSRFLQSLSFVSKLFISCLLSRKKKSGLAENSMDSIIDEMDKVITMHSSSNLNKNLLKENIDLKKMLYGASKENLRIEGFKFVVQELVESGILLQQHPQGERLTIVKLNISDDEIINVLKNDENLHGVNGF